MGFDSDGYMFADEQFNLLDSESGNTCYYRHMRMATSIEMNGT